MLKLEGVIPPLVTPLTESGDIDTHSIHSLVEHLLAGGVHGLFALGSTGEAVAFDHEERAQIVRATVAAGRGRVPVLVGVTDTSIRRMFGYLDMARELGADGVVVMPQYYYLTNQPELLTFFRTIHQRSPLPVIAYNIPSMVKVGIEAATLAQLAQEGAICSIKDSSGDLSATRDMLMQVLAVSDVTVLTGLEFVVDSAIALGMHGSVPGLGNVAPRAYVDVYNLAKAGDLTAAGKIQEQLITLFKIIRQARSGQSFSDSALGGFKTALKVLRVIKTNRMHAPWQGLNAAETEEVQAVMRESELF